MESFALWPFVYTDAKVPHSLSEKRAPLPSESAAIRNSPVAARARARVFHPESRIAAGDDGTDLQ